MPLTKDVKDTFPPPPHVIVSFFLLRMVEYKKDSKDTQQFRPHSSRDLASRGFSDIQ